MTSTVAVILFWGVPAINENKADNRVKNMVSQFKLVNEVINDGVIGQGVGSKKNVRITSDRGSVNINPSGTRFVIYYSVDPGFDFHAKGFDDANEKEFSLELSRSAGISLIIDYLDGSPLDIINPVLNPVSTRDPLIDEIKIEIKDGDPVGYIWVFDVGTIDYEFSADKLYSVSAENGGVQYGGYLFNEPDFCCQDDEIEMSIIKFDIISVSSVGWGGMVDHNPGGLLDINMNEVNADNTNIEFEIGLIEKKYYCDKETLESNLNLQIIGDSDSVQGWNNYFMNTNGFSQYDTGGFEDGTLYIEPGSNIVFNLIRSKCEVDVTIT